jgi:hypothetical protein
VTEPLPHPYAHNTRHMADTSHHVYCLPVGMCLSMAMAQNQEKQTGLHIPGLQSPTSGQTTGSST